MNFVSSRSNAREYERMCKSCIVKHLTTGTTLDIITTLGVGLSGTPLNEAVVMMNYIIPQFKQQNDLQKVNLCILSDGDSCPAAYGHEIYNEHKDEYYTVRPRRIDWYQVLREP